MIAPCCPNCIGDAGLEGTIFPNFTPSLGDCPRCGEVTTSLLSPSVLIDEFEKVKGIYKPASDGCPLLELLQKDWLLFPSERLNYNQAGDLLDAILGVPGSSAELMTLTTSPSSDTLMKWGNLRTELTDTNRYFLDQKIDESLFKKRLSLLPQEIKSNVWYRARIQNSNTPYKPDEMGAPLKGLASAGRANPIGIPYLYLASSVETAVSEVRPHPGDTISIAEFTLGSGVTVVDLRHPRKTVSPFVLTDSDEIRLVHSDLPFLEKLGQELSLPVIRSKAAIEYIPSQYLCEFIKKLNFDGVMYNSSVSSGTNIALFNEAKATVGNVSVFSVDGLDVRISKKP